MPKRQIKKISRNQECPCGSGKKYKNCCINKAFIWTEHSESGIGRVLPIDEELEGILESQRAEFKRRFGRKPAKDDPLFLAKYLMSPQDLERQLVETMEKAGVDPSKIYAYRKTGYLLSESRLDRATGAAIQEWNDAIDEFIEFGGDPEQLTDGVHFDNLLSLLEEELESLIYLFGLATDKFFNTDALPEPLTNNENILSPTQYQALCMVRTHRTLRTVKILLTEHMSDDILKLARSIYENYLHIIYIGRYPEKVADLVDAVLGLAHGTHRYKSNKDGSENRRTIVDIETGKEYLGQISAFKMAQASTIEEDLPFFDLFYKRTSEFVHPSPLSLDSYLSENGLDPVKNHMFEESVIFTACIACMVADHIPKMEGCPNQLAKDTKTVVKKIKKILQELLEMLDTWQQKLDANLEEVTLLQKRCARLAEK